MRLYLKFIILGTIVGIILSLIFPNSGFILGGLIVGYLIADNYLDGAVNSFLSQAIAGILASFLLPLVMWTFLNTPPHSQFSNPDTIFFGIILTGINYAVIGSIIGSVCGILGVFIKKIIEKNIKTNFKEKNILEISWKKIATIGIIGVIFLVAIVYVDFNASHYSPKEYVCNVSITNSSNGLCNVSFTTGIAVNMDYFGVEIMLLDSSNRVLTRQLVYNQTHVLKGQVFNISQSFNLSKSPTYVDVLFYDNPYAINEIDSAHIQYLFEYYNGTWMNPNFKDEDTEMRYILFKHDNKTNKS